MMYSVPKIKSDPSKHATSSASVVSFAAEVSNCPCHGKLIHLLRNVVAPDNPKCKPRKKMEAKYTYYLIRINLISCGNDYVDRAA